MSNIRGKDLTIKIPVQAYLPYKYYKRKNENSEWTKNYERKLQLSHSIMRAISLELIAKLNLEKAGTLDRVRFVYDFVHHINYCSRTDYYVKYPLETLAEQSGNCLDLSLLGGFFMSMLGIDAVLIDYEDHVMLGAHHRGAGKKFKFEGRTYKFLEMTGTDHPNHRDRNGIDDYNELQDIYAFDVDNDIYPIPIKQITPKELQTRTSNHLTVHKHQPRD